ncbi:cyclic GMP-AMP phosphodiesterase SMPDL3A-like isoform X2 [Clytia hemisphaerica]
MNQTGGYKVNFTEGSAPYGRVHCDSPYKLVQSSADYIGTLNEESNVKAQFILLSGDQAAHAYSKFPEVDAYKSLVWSIVNSTRIFYEATGLPIIFSIGNNDIPLHYNPPVEHPESFYGDLSNEVTKYIFPKSSVLAELNSVKEFNESFLQGGYYVVNVSEFLQLITLSTNYWNSRCFTINPSITTIGDRQMKWLENTLKTAAATNKKVLVSGHIPAGISTYKDEGSFWLKNYTTVYVKLMTDFADIITGQFYGHAHKDKIKIQNVHDSFYPNTQPSIPKAFLLMSPSITPIQGNNAAFRLFTLSKDLELSDYTQYYMDFILANVFSKPSWKKEYTFSECYGASISAKSIQDIVQNVISSSDNSTWVRYMTHMRTLYGGFSTEVMFREYCGAQHFTLEAYLACVKYYETNGF